MTPGINYFLNPYEPGNIEITVNIKQEDDQVTTVTETIFIGTDGCMDDTATTCNYDSNAIVDSNDVCTYDLGCTCTYPDTAKCDNTIDYCYNDGGSGTYINVCVCPNEDCFREDYKNTQL